MLIRKTMSLTATTLLAVAVLAGCSTAADEPASAATPVAGAASASAEPVAENATISDASVQEALDANLPYEVGDTSYQSGTTIALNGTSATVDGTGAAVDGGTVTITEAGTYIVSGDLSDGSLVVNAAGAAVKIVLDGASITSSTTSPLQVTDADQVSVILADGSENTLVDAAVYTYPDAETDEPNAALFSKADLTIGGSGSLTVTGNANDGIASKDGLVIAGGNIAINAADDGLRGKDYLVMLGGTVTVQAQGDALKSDNTEDPTVGYIAVLGGTVTAEAGDDALSAASDVIVGAGTMTTQSVGKGLNGDVSVVIGGDAMVTATGTDDTVHSGQTVTISGGTLALATQDDGIHADSDVNISGGSVTVSESEEGIEGGHIAISGGVIDVTSRDDGLNAASDTVSDLSLVISGGTLSINAGGDGLDSNGTLTVSGGETVVYGPTDDGNGALDAEGEFTVSGGTLIAVGSAGMALAPSTASAQGWIAGTVQAGAGSTLTITDSDGNELASVTLPKDVASVVFSSADVVTGSTYSVNVDGSTVTSLVAGQTTFTGMPGGMGGGMGGPGGPGGAGGR